MARNDSISRRIARERGRAGVLALIAALPALFLAASLVYAGFSMIEDARSGDTEWDGAIPVLAILAVFTILFLVIARWSYDSARAALTPQRIQAMWLRRFQSEGDGAFRTSRVIDRLSRYGVGALTLQDRDVQLSFEQRRNRLAPLFWLLFIPIAAALAFFMWHGWEAARTDIMDLEPARDLQSGIGQALGAIFALIAVAMLFLVGFFAAVLATVLLVMLIAAISGPLGAFMARNRDDFKALPRHLQRFERGKRRGSLVLRIADANWREAVTSSLAVADVAIIDLTDVSEHVAWEIAEAAKACTPAGLVFICREGAALSEPARAAVRNALGREIGAVAYYPARRGKAQRFARDLREHIYAAADVRHT